MDRRTFVKGTAAGLTLAGMPVTFMPALAGESQAERDRRMAWWREARFGMFIHWGIYSVPAGVWKGRKVKAFPAEWIQYARNIPKREYRKLAPQFDPVKFDAHEWARIAKNAGMKYLVITSKHHDGFCMFDSKLTEWDIMDSSPFKRDVIKELSEACADEGVRFGLYYSQLDWSRSVWPYSANYMPRFKKYMEYMEGQVKEILTNYGPICSLFFDGDWIPQWNEDWGREVESLCRKLQPDTIINSRLGKRSMEENISALTGKSRPMQAPRVGDYATPEQFIPTVLPECDWETCMTMNDSWGYRSWDDNWKSVETLIRNLIDIASKGGNYLLNVGPTSQGIIPGPSVERLAAVGEWMNKNGEAIYGTSAGPIQGAPWGRSTSKGDKVYLHVFDWPAGSLEVEGLGEGFNSAGLLGGQSLSIKRAGDKIVIDLPERAPDKYASVIALSS